MTPHELDKLHARMREIKRLDDMLDRMGKGIEDKIDDLGDKIIGVLGRNVIDKRKNWVGEVAFVALFNALREKRERLRDEIKDRVDVSECPHAIQTVQEVTE